MKIMIDSREHGTQDEKKETGLYRYDRAKQYYTEQDHECLIRQLPYGDYCFEDKVVFEYKTIHDYMTSLGNGSLFEEVSNQAKHYTYNYIVIVGNLQNYFENSWKLPIIRRAWQHNYQKFIVMSTSSYKGSLRRLRCYSTPIHCRTEEEAFNEMLQQSKKCLNPKIYGGTKRPVISNDIVTYTLSGCGGVKDKLITNIKETLNCNNLPQLIGLTVDDFQSVPKIGEKKAQKIYEWVHQGE